MTKKNGENADPEKEWANDETFQMIIHGARRILKKAHNPDLYREFARLSIVEDRKDDGRTFYNANVALSPALARNLNGVKCSDGKLRACIWEKPNELILKFNRNASEGYLFSYQKGSAYPRANFRCGGFKNPTFKRKSHSRECKIHRPQPDCVVLYLPTDADDQLPLR